MSDRYIELIGASENNLKDVNLKIPKNKITVFTGVSGSGKSSIVFDTIYQEARRELNETYDAFVRFYLPKAQRPNIKALNNISLAIAIDQRPLGGNSRSTVGTITDINPLLRLMFAKFSKPNLGSRAFYSFNDPHGMCEECEGIGKTTVLDIDKAIDVNLSLEEGAILFPQTEVGARYYKMYAESKFFDVSKKLKDYSKKEMNDLLYTDGIKVEAGGMNLSYEGLVTKFNRQFNGSAEKSEKTMKQIDGLVTTGLCTKCLGKRFNDKVLNSKIDKYNIADMLDMQIDELIVVLKSIKIDDTTVSEVIIDKLKQLANVGLEYLSLSRETSTLSGGEGQRIKMVKHLTNSLTDVIYIFDEPSTGLHVKDVNKLNDMIISLRDKGNTVLIVEHDPDVIKIADHIVDVGPHAGKNGGVIMFEGSYSDLKKSDTLTGKFLDKEYTIKDNPRVFTDFITTSKSSLNNLKNVSLKVPKGIFTVVTGVAGSGKSTLVEQVFLKENAEAVHLSQKPIATNSRSNALTYLGIMDEIRKLFAKESGLKPALFSYNSKGACENCKGKGELVINLSFLEDKKVVCDECNGDRYKPEVLKHKYNGKNIVEILEMSVEEAVDFFDNKKVTIMLEKLREVGLSYLVLGQSLSTISGGEAQRLNLAKSLVDGADIYVFDEPTTGLHLSDISLIIDIINNLVEDGKTVLVIEHNIEVIKAADYIIDVGPEGGNAGGTIIYEGPINEIGKSKDSVTGKYIV